MLYAKRYTKQGSYSCSHDRQLSSMDMGVKYSGKKINNQDAVPLESSNRQSNNWQHLFKEKKKISKHGQLQTY